MPQARKEEVLHRISRVAASSGELLSLSGLNLSVLPDELWKITRLTSLHLERNQLKSLPPEIGQLTQLTSLNLAGSQLQSLPPEIGQLTQLGTVKLTTAHGESDQKVVRRNQFTLL